jgi:hypothetical protein
MSFALSLINVVSCFMVAMVSHELGHYLAARACGVPIKQVGLGWGPTLFRRIVGGVDCELRSLPLGAYVQMDMNILQTRPIIQQLLVLTAGILANFALAAITWRTTFGALNLGLAIGNILPLYQHDGWKSCLVISRWAFGRPSPVVEWSFTIIGGLMGLGILVGAVLAY